MNHDALDVWRSHCDPLADAVLEELMPGGRGAHGFSALLDAAKERAASDPESASGAWLASTRETPAWAKERDWGPGRRMFERFGVLTFLVGMNVLVESYAGGQDNAILMMSGRLSDRRAFRRLAETGKFTLEVVLGSQPGAPGHEALLSVRLLHARVRQLCRLRGYDVAARDEPINQEAMAGTLMLFSCGMIRALERIGVFVSDEEKESYHALWRYAGWVMGVEEALLPETYDEEVALWEAIKAHSMHPNEDSVTLFEHAVGGIASGARELPLPQQVMGAWALSSETFVRQFIGHCVDPGYRDHLRIERRASWAMGFVGARSLISAGTKVLRRAPRLERALESGQRYVVGELVEAMLNDEPARFDNPGFSGEAS